MEKNEQKTKMKPIKKVEEKVTIEIDRVVKEKLDNLKKWKSGGFHNKKTKEIADRWKNYTYSDLINALLASNTILQDVITGDIDINYLRKQAIDNFETLKNEPEKLEEKIDEQIKELAEMINPPTLEDTQEMLKQMVDGVLMKQDLIEDGIEITIPAVKKIIDSGKWEKHAQSWFYKLCFKRLVEIKNKQANRG